MGKKKAKERHSDELPDEIPEGVTLELYKGAWALDINGDLFVFPQHLTRSEAEAVLAKAILLRKGN